MLSTIVNDKRVVEAAKDAVRVIVRRPHAYKFRDQHEESPIPGLVVLDADGRFVGGVKLPSKEAVERTAELLRK